MILHSFLSKEILFLLFLGMIPSIIWLCIFMRKDDHPEPKRMILLVFICGFFSVLVAAALQWLLYKTIQYTALPCLYCPFTANISPTTADITRMVVFVSITVASMFALIEEYVKYMAARLCIVKSPYFDEPVDAMIYCITAALGFAAAENIFYLLSDMSNVIPIIIIRFFTSTLLHVFASAIVGYFFALSFIHIIYRRYYIAIGMLCAVLLHTIFNMIISAHLYLEWKSMGVFLLVLLICLSSYIVSFLFRHIKRMTFPIRM